jgi:hypothetical protein
MYKIQTANAKCKMKPVNVICNLQTAITMYGARLAIVKCKAASCVGITITCNRKMTVYTSSERL